MRTDKTEKEGRTHCSNFSKGEVACSEDSLMFNGNLVFQIEFCGKNPALRYLFPK